MKTHRLTLSAVMTSAMLAACTQLPDPVGITTEDGSPIVVSVTASDGIQTRGIITGTTLENGSRVGLSLCDVSGTKYQGITYENICYTASGSGSSQKWDAESPIMVANTPGTLYGYYPYSESVTDIKKINITADSNNQTDYLWATPVSNITKANADAAVVMNHALAAVRLSVSRGTYSGTGRVTEASISGADIATSAVLNARTGGLSSYKGYSTAISPAITAFTLSPTASAIDILAIPCGNSTVNLKVTLTIDGNVYETSIPSAVIKQGNMTECKISVNDGEVYVTSVNVTAWKQNAAGSQIIQKDYKVSFAGDMEGLSFSNSVDDEGNVTILAVPYISEDAETKPVTISGTATLEQSVDDKSGILTIKLSDIASDVTVNFNGFWLWMTFVHEVTDISKPTQIYYGGSPERLKMDGEEIAIDMYYQFETPGEHVMKMAIKNYKGYQYSFMQYILTVTSAIFPEGMESIGAWCFLGCSNLKEVSLPSTLKSISYQAFERSGLTSCVIPDGCWISYGLFDDCTSLTYVKLPSHMESIPSGTFQGCTALRSFEMPSGVKSIGYNAFQNSGLEVIHFPDAVSVIESQVCKNCKNLKEVRFPASLKTIEMQAFSFSDNIERFIMADGTVCTDEIIIPEGVTTMEDLVFYFRNPNFKSMRIPSTLTSIADGALSCPNLERYVMTNPSSKYDIRNNSLIETATNRLIAGASLSSKIHESVTTIGRKAFYESCLSNVDLHKGVTTIEDYAFDYSDITQIICRGIVPPTLGESPFRLTNYSGLMKVPSESISQYRSEWYRTDVGYLGWTNYRWGLVALAEGE